MTRVEERGGGDLYRRRWTRALTRLLSAPVWTTHRHMSPDVYSRHRIQQAPFNPQHETDWQTDRYRHSDNDTGMCIYIHIYIHIYLPNSLTQSPNVYSRHLSTPNTRLTDRQIDVDVHIMIYDIYIYIYIYTCIPYLRWHSHNMYTADMLKPSRIIRR